MNQPATQKCPINEAVEDFVSGYEVDSGEGIYTPTEHERFLLTDAINSLLNDEDSMAIIMPAILADRAQHPSSLAPTASDAVDELVRDLYNFEGGRNFAARLEKLAASLAPTVAGSVDTLEDGVEHSPFRDIVQDIISEAHGDHRGAWAYKCPSWKKLVAHINALIAPAAPSGEPDYYVTKYRGLPITVTLERPLNPMPGFVVVPTYTHPAPSSPAAPGQQAQAVPEGGEA